MKIKVFCFVISFVSIFSVVHAQADFRELKWGMSIDQVSNLEGRNITGEIRSNQFYTLVSEGISVGGKIAKVEYTFENGKLSKIVSYFKFSYSPDFWNFGSISFQLSDLFQTLENKGYKIRYPMLCGDHPYDGPDLNIPENIKILEMTSWKLDFAKTTILKKLESDEKYKCAFMKFESSRSDATIAINAKHTINDKSSHAYFILTPSDSVQKSINQNDF
ncbi:hypothetical protein EGI31_22530 [Lacihabitans soyangensis]|uniref:DUF3108 domain-containing protein n=2 Tax=Lacihabitans soyangensis TaxID=869394 RepID=A0AAE3H3G2_9BACT|nr:hypothetical protein [Lacihabitans soyangensis]MCP9764272.1 hypothetical protein [Lacihabitans soyangensis]MCP9765721.1 hypothetical protein [Lacihabitans soyangensis]